MEKIKVTYTGPPESTDDSVFLIMNKHVSTPYNCAMHINEFLMKRSIIALVDGEPWDMHRPLENDCELELKHMLDEDPSLPNQVFWRTGSFVLGYIIESAFKDNIYVELCDYPRTKIEHGCFMYDVDLKLPDWNPTQLELNCLSRLGGSLWTKELDFEPLDVSGDLALQMFEDNRHKTKLLHQLLEYSNSQTIRLYRMGNYVDFIKGPLVGNTSQLQRFSVTAVHQVESDMYGKVYRFQALALPTDLKMHWWAWEFLCRRAAVPNKTPIHYINKGTSEKDMKGVPELVDTLRQTEAAPS